MQSGGSTTNMRGLISTMVGMVIDVVYLGDVIYCSTMRILKMAGLIKQFESRVLGAAQ